MIPGASLYPAGDLSGMAVKVGCILRTNTRRPPGASALEQGDPAKD